MENIFKSIELLFAISTPDSKDPEEHSSTTSFEIEDVRVDVYHLEDQFSASRQVARIKTGKDTFLAYQGNSSPHIEKQITILELIKITAKYPNLRGTIPPLSSSYQAQKQFLGVEVMPLMALCPRLKDELEQRDLYDDFVWNCEEITLLTI